MKNIVLGIIGIIIAWYTMAAGLSIYEISVEVCVCDMEKGELTVRMIETFQLPGGKEKTIEKSLSCHAQERL